LPGFNRLNQDAPLRTVEQVKLMLVPVPTGPPIRLDRERMSIGRAPGSAIHLDSPSVSSQHAELSLDGQWWRIRDLNSRNGIRVNGVATTDQLLWPGDKVSIAEQFHFVLRPIARAKRRFPWWIVALVALVVIVAAGGYVMLTHFR
jgi:pSer/pThr/pTyr-binding forkhead associated (FHA) protein